LLGTIGTDEPLDGFTHRAERAAHCGRKACKATLEVLPQPLNGVELWAVGRQVDQHDVGRDEQGFGDMGGGVVEHQEVEAVGVLAAEVLQKDLKAGTVEAW
jgi:hypothetical protein